MSTDQWADPPHHAQVQRNKGAAGIDGMSVEALSAHLKDHWPTIEELLAGISPEGERRLQEEAVQRTMKTYGFTEEQARRLYLPE
jgi:hypothetical protein